jgi:hypothetical protein
VKFLSAALPSLVAPEELELAWSVCSDIGNAVFEEMCLRRLEQVLPNSHRIEQNRFQKFIDAGRYAEASLLLQNSIPGYTSDFVEFHKELLPRLASTPEPDYESILRSVGLRWNSLLERGRLICAADARRKNVPHKALRILLSEQAQEPVSERIGMSILRSLEEVFLQLPGGATVPEDHEDLIRSAVLELVHYSALHPAETTIRNGLSNVLSPATSGMTGLFVIATVALDLSSSQTVVRSGRLRHDRPSVGLAELPRLLEPVLEWMSREGPVVIGRCVIPKELLTVPADELVPPLERLLHGEANKLIDEGDFKTFEHILYPGVLAARHSSHVGDDLVLLRLAASKLALAGRSQKARDVTEQCLQLAGEDALRSRLAWFAYADVYERLHNPLEALIGMACTFACQADVSTEQAWYEIYLLIRVFRDLHLTELAKPLLSRGQSLVHELGPDGEYQHRFVTIELGLRLFELNPNSDGGTADIEEFLGKTERLCSEVLKRNDDIVPAATLLAQGIYFCHLRGLAVPENVSATLNSVLLKIEEPLRETIRALTTKTPSAQQVLSLVRRVEPARYSSDTGFDLQYAVIGGRRLLDSPETLREPEQIAFAIEILADQSLQRHSGATPNEDALHGLPKSIEEPRKLLEEFSRSGINVLMMGVSSAGRLIGVTARDGALGPLISNNSAFSAAGLAEWAKRFPYGYGAVSPTDNTFYTSMRSLGITIEEPRPTLLIVDAALAQVPANLLFIGDEFVGRTTPVGAAPSIAWLRSATSQPRCASGQRIAWISTSGNGSTFTALSMLSTLLAPTLERHGFELKTESEVPEELRGAEIAIVAAHGGLVADGHYFSLVADEQDLRITSGSLASSLRSVELAILFVCSGGRFDKHPFANTTVGLARDLLNRGCRTVIASPWPLDSGVPPRWLPRFLESWEAGASAIEANFEANQAVERVMGDAPARCLAMAVFGDPLLKKLP